MDERSTKVLLVGESNPYGDDPRYALYPAPDGCSGHRLCVKVFGMTRCAYLDTFDRVNLCAGKWSMKEARAKVSELYREYSRFVLCGSKVTSAFGYEFQPFVVHKHLSDSVAVIGHPSGLCRLWHEPGAFQRAREALLKIAPELAGVVGAALTVRES